VTEFRVWAPEQSRMRVRVGGSDIGMRPDERAGWWLAEVERAGQGSDYAFLIGDDDAERPDPRSRWQPHGVHGPSRVYDHSAYVWGDAAWTGRQLPGSVIYEMHIGTFTPDGTFDAAVDRLDYLVQLGVDFVELLPVNAFNGERNWGYDGVCWYAPQQSYGGPDGLKRFVDACHRRGVGVLIDAVYNHFGPSGAYAPMFAPYLTFGSNTWGRSLNLDGPASDDVRRYIIDSALAWLRDYHADGLRLDAVHALVDHRAQHLLEQMAVETAALSAHLGRPLTLIAESDLNDARLITSREAGGYGLDAQWDDDVHHALHALLTGERQGYYGDFGSLECLAKTLEGGFFHAGTWSSFRQRTHGRPVPRLTTPGHRFIAYLQDHDQIGNRATGDRLSATLSPDLLKVGAVLLFASAFTPMLFMGEEWAASTPWQFFTSHPEPELAAAVAGGRLAEFAEHGWMSDDVPDPQDPDTFGRSKLKWSEISREPHAGMLAFYRSLIALRKAQPALTDPALTSVRVTYGEKHIVIWRDGVCAVANLGETPLAADVDGASRLLLGTTSGIAVEPGCVRLPGVSAALVALVDATV
jgi:maltooligosyltrehalose trehalohydrolase